MYTYTHTHTSSLVTSCLAENFDAFTSLVPTSNTIYKKTYHTLLNLYLVWDCHSKTCKYPPALLASSLAGAVQKF